MLQKTLDVGGGKLVTFKSSAAVPRLYRVKFRRDIFRDMERLNEGYRSNVDKPTSDMEVELLEIFENVAYIMAYHADSSIPDTIDEWLEGFEMFSIYSVLPELMDLWNGNTYTDVEAKKNSDQPNEK